MMILQKSEIKDIIDKKSDKKGNLHISEIECLNLIETYIFYKKGVKVGDIVSPTSILQKYINEYGVAGKVIGQKHLQLMHEATDIAWSYFVKELNESFTKEGL